jgi:multidrug efflux pump subunit AcrB
VPSRCAAWLKAHAESDSPGAREHGADSRTTHHAPRTTNALARAFAKWEGLINLGIGWYTRQLHRVMRHRVLTVVLAGGLLVAVVVGLGSQLRREFFPEVDAGAFEMTVRAPSGTRIEITEDKIKMVEKFIQETTGDDVETIISEIGVTPDWSAAYTPNSGPMDTVVKVQLTAERSRSAQEYVALLRQGLKQDSRFTGLEFSFDAGGMIRGAMNEGKSTPNNVRILAKELPQARRVAEKIMQELANVDGVVDLRILQRLDYPRIMITVDRAKAAEHGFTQEEVMKNVVAALNSSIQFNKRIFWIDPVSHNQYYVGVQYFEEDIRSIETLLNVPITSEVQKQPIPLSNLISYTYSTVPAEITHNNLQGTMDLTMGVAGRDLGHVADDVYAVVSKFGVPLEHGAWAPYDPKSNPDDPNRPLLEGARITLSGEYSKMQDTFANLGKGLVLAALLIYFLMAALFKSYITPLVVMSAVPVGLVGVVTMLFLTGTAINVQSLLGVIFMVGIVVSNTVLMTDFAQKLRENEGLTPTQAIMKAASIRVRPVVMTALAAFFALVPMALAVERGSEANAPLGRAVIGGLLAGLVTTLFVVPAIYSLVIKDAKTESTNPQLQEVEL